LPAAAAGLLSWVRLPAGDIDRLLHGQRAGGRAAVAARGSSRRAAANAGSATLSAVAES